MVINAMYGYICDNEVEEITHSLKSLKIIRSKAVWYPATGFVEMALTVAHRQLIHRVTKNDPRKFVFGGRIIS